MEWATKHGLSYTSWEELPKHPKVVELINNEVQEKNESLASFETLKKVIIAPNEFSVSSGELTPSLKVKNKVVIEKYRTQLDNLYEE